MTYSPQQQQDFYHAIRDLNFGVNNLIQNTPLQTPTTAQMQALLNTFAASVTATGLTLSGS